MPTVPATEHGVMQSGESQFSQSQADSESSSTSAQDEGSPATGPQGRRPEAASGAPPSNTAPGNCNSGGGGGFLLLRFGIDSLYVSFQGKLFRDKANALHRLRELAQSQYERDQALATVSHNGHEFKVNAKRGKQFAYLLDSPCYHISLASVSAGSVPMAYVQIKSTWLTEQGVRGAIDQLIDIIKSLGEIKEGPTVSRADIFVDAVTGLHLESLCRNDWVTRARTIDDYGYSLSSTGFVFGRGGEIVGRFYDKTEEIKAKKGEKDYLKALWSEQGWIPGQAVHRMEFQLRSSVLRQFGIKTIETLLERCPAVWRYCTGDWLKLVIPNPEDETRARWPVHPVWTLLHATPWEGLGTAVRVNATQHCIPPTAMLAARSLSALSCVMAAQRIDDAAEGVHAQHRLMKEHYDSLAFVTGEDFNGVLREKVRMKCREYSVAHPESVKRRDEILRQGAAEDYRKERDGE